MHLTAKCARVQVAVESAPRHRRQSFVQTVQLSMRGRESDGRGIKIAFKSTTGTLQWLVLPDRTFQHGARTHASRLERSVAIDHVRETFEEARVTPCLLFTAFWLFTPTLPLQCARGL
eukprot:2029196-Amphidinium_carterae.1